MKYIETDRLLLRPVREADGLLVCRLMNEPKYVKYVGERGIADATAGKAFIKEKMLPQYIQRGYSNHVIVRKSDEVEIGTVGLFHRHGSVYPDLGYALLAAYEGQGYATEASLGQLAAGFCEYGLAYIDAYVLPHYGGSNRVLHRLGMRQIAGVRWGEPGEWLLQYSMSRATFHHEYPSLSHLHEPSSLIL